MTLEDNVAPQLHYLIQKEARDQEFCFIMVEKSAGADRKRSMRKIRSHTLKHFHRKQRLAGELLRVKPSKLPLSRGPFPSQPLPSSLDTLPIPIGNFGHLRSYSKLADMYLCLLVADKNQVRDFMSRNGAGKILGPLLAEDPTLSYAFEFFAQTHLDAVRFLSSSRPALAIKTVVLRELHKRLLGNNNNINLLVMMLLLAGTSVGDS